MITFVDTALAKLSVHRSGNKSLEEYLILSEKELPLEDALLSHLLMQYFLVSFVKVNEIYSFYHPGNKLEMNEVYSYVSEIFNNKEHFHECSKQIARHLHDSSNHPNIKSGEVYIAYFTSLGFEGENFEAIGIFKSEQKETYLKVHSQQEGFGLTYVQDGIDIRKLDKGCLIFNTRKEDGYRVAIIDQTSRGTDAVYWKDDFLKVKIRDNEFSQTSNVLGVYKNFVTQHLDDEFELSKTDKIDLLNKSMKYFKEKEKFDMDEFGSEVIGDPAGIESFKSFKNNFEQNLNGPIPDSFEISDAAVKKQSRVFKSVLKLDRNFHIYIHGDKQLIEKGFDEGKAMNYYKVFFKEEQ